MSIFESYLQDNVPTVYARKVADRIKKKIAGLQLPDISSEKSKIQRILNPKDYTYKSDIYGLAVKFLHLRDSFYKLYSHDMEEEKYMKILEFITPFDEYTDLVRAFENNQGTQNYILIIEITQQIRFYVELFVNKYDFMLKSKEDFINEFMGVMEDDEDDSI